MHVASLELSKTLFELSGWDGTYHVHAVLDDPYLTTKVDAKGMEQDWVPAYDLGYLLLKLPNEATSKKHGGYHYLYLHHGKLDWYAYYGEIDTTEFMSAADTPEDAACKLAIELFKQGVLNREEP